MTNDNGSHGVYLKDHGLLETQLIELQLTSEVNNKLSSITGEGPLVVAALQRISIENDST